jgi:hypothetical protein
MHSRFNASIIESLCWPLKPRSKPPSRDPDLESIDINFHDMMRSPLPVIYNLRTQGPDPGSRMYMSEKEANKIYVKSEILT